VLVAHLPPETLHYFAQNQLPFVGASLYFAMHDPIHGTELGRFDFGPSLQPGDTDGDVDLNDLNNVRNHFGEVGENLLGDANADGSIDLADLNAARNNFDTSVAPS
jgi:hypothetical protein